MGAILQFKSTFLVKTIISQWYLCLGCNQRKTINFTTKEKEKTFVCECGKIKLIKQK
jgi:hypothetical protein